MSIISTAVRYLLAAGVTGDALCDAIAAMEADLRNEPKPRSSAAIRQERYRHNKASRVTESDVCDTPLSLPPNDIYSNPPTHTPGYNTPVSVKPAAKPKRQQAVPMPEGVSPQVWKDFTDQRAKRGGLSQTALAGIEREAVKAGWSLECALSEVVTRNWQGFKADWVAGEEPKTGSGPPGSAVVQSFQARRSQAESQANR